MKKMSLFYKIYFTVIAVFLVLLIASLFVLNSVLKAYEAAQPVGYVNNIITEYLQKGDLYGAAKKYDIELSVYEDKNDVNAEFKKILDGKKLTIASSGKKLEGYNEVYNVKIDDEAVVTFYLKKSKTAGKFGIKGYEVGLAELNKDLCHNYEIRVPSDVKLTINGVEVKKSDRKDLAVPAVLTDKIGTGEKVTHQVFQLNNFLCEGFDIKAFAADGSEIDVKKDGSVYVVEQSIDKATYDANTNFALNACQDYAKFMQKDASRGSITHYFDTTTEFYNYIKKTEIWVWDHSGYRFEDVIITEAHQYTDTLFACRVNFTQVLVRGNENYKDYFDKYVYIEKTDNGLKVIDMQTPEKK